MRLSDNAKKIIDMIEADGFEAYAVGGCVRDHIMERPCGDIDLCTSAKPWELEEIFSRGCVKFIETGLKHGTITAVIGDESFEITTFRTENGYGDFRHPDRVDFISDIKEDLSRRDFTVNAMAFNDKSGIIDLFGGQNDIENKIIRTVGDPDTRFREDALRIMRAIRFACVLGFDIEKDTKASIFKNRHLLKNISAERIYAELTKTLLGKNIFTVLKEYKEVFAAVLPELRPIFNIPQNTDWHIYDVWTHTAKSIEQIPDDPALKYTMLFHDIGKAFTRTTDKNSVDHFKGHQKISAEYAQSALNRLKAPLSVSSRVMKIVPIHDMHIGTDKIKIKKWLNNIGEDALRDLILVKKADKAAQNIKKTAPELKNLDITQRTLEEILINNEPYKISDLDIDGNDLKRMGYNGREIGYALDFLIDAVICDKVKNEKEKLMLFLKNRIPNN